MIEEILIKDVTTFKLTIAKDRTTIKIPQSSTLPVETRLEIIEFLQRIIKEVGPTERTLRGKYKNEQVIMCTDNKKIFKTFKK